MPYEQVIDVAIQEKTPDDDLHEYIIHFVSWYVRVPPPISGIFNNIDWYHLPWSNNSLSTCDQSNLNEDLDKLIVQDCNSLQDQLD